jgi:Tfp pilus assembly protein PilF
MRISRRACLNQSVNMKRVIKLLFLLTGLLIVGCSSSPVNRAVQQDPARVDALEAAKTPLKVGNLDIAEQELMRLWLADPSNKEVNSYLNRVHYFQYQQRRHEQEADLWYPTLPPKRVQ